MKDKINVITGAPSSGKSSVLRELQARGHNTLPEGARIVIDQFISKGYTAAEARESPYFREMIVEKNRDIEGLIQDYPDDPFFLDRSLVDNLAFMRLNNEDISETLWRECGNQQYDNVFLFERLPIEEDAVREEDDEECDQIQRQLRSVYEELGYSVTTVPVLPVYERASYIEDEITKKPPIH